MSSPPWISGTRVITPHVDADSFICGDLSDVPWQASPLLNVTRGKNADGSYSINQFRDAPTGGMLPYLFNLPTGTTSGVVSFDVRGSGTIVYELLDSGGVPIGGTTSSYVLTGTYSTRTIAVPGPAGVARRIAIYVNSLSKGTTAQVVAQIRNMRMTLTGPTSPILSGSFRRFTVSHPMYAKSRQHSPRFPDMSNAAPCVPLAMPNAPVTFLTDAASIVLEGLFTSVSSSMSYMATLCDGVWDEPNNDVPGLPKFHTLTYSAPVAPRELKIFNAIGHIQAVAGFTEMVGSGPRAIYVPTSAVCSLVQPTQRIDFLVFADALDLGLSSDPTCLPTRDGWVGLMQAVTSDKIATDGYSSRGLWETEASTSGQFTVNQLVGQIVGSGASRTWWGCSRSDWIHGLSAVTFKAKLADLVDKVLARKPTHHFFLQGAIRDTSVPDDTGLIAFNTAMSEIAAARPATCTFVECRVRFGTGILDSAGIQPSKAGYATEFAFFRTVVGY